MNLLRELTNVYGYKEVDKIGNNLLLEKSSYLDNGYGCYTDVNVILEYNKKTNEIGEIYVDDKTAEQWRKEVEDHMSRCQYIQKYDSCLEQLIDEITNDEWNSAESESRIGRLLHLIKSKLDWWYRKEERLKKEFYPDCAKCIQLEMIASYAESVEQGSWW